MKEYEQTGELLVELGSDQTSLHNPFGGGYYPVQLGFDEAQQVMEEDPARFRELVQERSVRTLQLSSISLLSVLSLFFFLLLLTHSCTCLNVFH